MGGFFLVQLLQICTKIVCLQKGLLMTLFQLRAALLLGRISRIEVLALRCCGYQVRAITAAGRAHVVSYTPTAVLWPSLVLLKTHLRQCGVRSALFQQPESHDEIIGRPQRLEPDPGLWLQWV